MNLVVFFADFDRRGCSNDSHNRTSSTVGAKRLLLPSVRQPSAWGRTVV